MSYLGFDSIEDYVAHLKAKSVKEDFGGDACQYEKMIEYGRRDNQTWDELMAYATVFPELKEDAITLIEKQLGYLPLDEISMKHEVFLRMAIMDLKSQRISQNDFDLTVTRHCKHIRNDDMQKHGWLQDLPAISEKTQVKYDTELLPFKLQAQERIKKFVPGDLPLEITIWPEMYLRQCLANEEFFLPPEITPPDMRALTGLYYRWAYLEQGQTAADDLELMT